MKNLIKMASLALITILWGCENSFEETTPEPNSEVKIVEFISFNDEQSIEIGEQSPNFTMNPNSDMEFDIRDFRGKVLMLEFSAEWCSICKSVAPRIAEASEMLDTSKFAIIKIYDDYFSKELFLKDAEKFDSPYYKVWNGIHGGFDLTKLFDIRSFPRAIFIDKEGIVREIRSTSSTNIVEVMQSYDS